MTNETYRAKSVRRHVVAVVEGRGDPSSVIRHRPEPVRPPQGAGVPAPDLPEPQGGVAGGGAHPKDESEIAVMREAGAIVREALQALGPLVRPGVSTEALGRRVEEILAEHGAIASFLGLYGFPASICASVNDVVVHGIPSARQVLAEGDIVGIDLGVCVDGYHADGAFTFAAGRVDRRVRRLLEATREALVRGIAAARVGNRVQDVSRAVQEHVEGRYGFSCVRDLCGHGIGRRLHEEPQVPNFVSDDPGPALVEGMTLAIEPMVNMGRPEVYTDSADRWSVRTRDGKPSAHFEHTVVVRPKGGEILT